MPRPIDITKYPSQFMELASRYEADPSKEIAIPSDNPQKLQQQLIAFRRAMRHQDKEKHPYFSGCEIRISDEANGVVVGSKSRTASALAIEKALSSLEQGDIAGKPASSKKERN